MKEASCGGMLEPEELRDLIGRGEIDTLVLVFPELSGRLVGKRIAGRFFLQEILSAGSNRLVAGQPDDGFSYCRPRRPLAGRVSHPGGGRQPLPRLRGRLHGLPEPIEPRPIFAEDACSAGSLPRGPLSLTEASQEFEASDLLAGASSEEVVSHLFHFARTEERKLDEAPTGFERRRYLEGSRKRVRRPTIGISSYPREGTPAEFSMPCGYVDAVRGAGAMAVILPPGEATPEDLLVSLDGLVISGGGDLDPRTYGGEQHGSLYEICPARDRFELALTRALLARQKLPALFICRGLQVLNTACGGTLYVHIPDHFGDKLLHRLPPRDPVRHTVRIDEGSRLAIIVGATEIEVCSWHHQAIDRLGEGLRPIAWSEDGVIEAIEHISHPWCIGLQWHPEMQLEEEHARRLFSALVSAAQQKEEEK